MNRKTYVDSALIGIFRVQIVEDAEEVIGAVQLSASNGCFLPVEWSRIPGALRHRPVAEETQKIGQRFQAKSFDRSCNTIGTDKFISRLISFSLGNLPVSEQAVNMSRAVLTGMASSELFGSRRITKNMTFYQLNK